MVGQYEGNSSEDEVGELSVGEVSGGSSSVRNMTCARDHVLESTHTKKTAM